ISSISKEYLELICNQYDENFKLKVDQKYNTEETSKDSWILPKNTQKYEVKDDTEGIDEIRDFEYKSFDESRDALWIIPAKQIISNSNTQEILEETQEESSQNYRKEQNSKAYNEEESLNQNPNSKELPNKFPHEQDIILENKIQAIQDEPATPDFKNEQNMKLSVSNEKNSNQNSKDEFLIKSVQEIDPNSVDSTSFASFIKSILKDQESKKPHYNEADSKFDSLTSILSSILAVENHERIEKKRPEEVNTLVNTLKTSEPPIKKLENAMEHIESSNGILSGWFSSLFPNGEKFEPTSKSSISPTLKKSKCSQWVGIDKTFDFCLVCADNRYVNRPEKSFLCQSSCTQPGADCPKTHCACETPEMEDKASQCKSPRICKLDEFKAVPGTIATDAWCNQTCKSSNKEHYCPCTLCECAVQCSIGIVNGNFLKGLNGWKAVRQTDSKGSVAAEPIGRKLNLSQKQLPLKSDSAEDRQNYAAVFDHKSPGSYVLYQEIVPTQGDILQFSWLVSNYADDYYVQEDTMSANVYKNQQFRVDIFEPFGESSTQSNRENNWKSGDTTANYGKSWFQFENGGPTPLATILTPHRVRAIMNAIGPPPVAFLNPWQKAQYDLSPFAGQQIWIVFRAVNNQGIMNVGIDDVIITNKICTEPPSTPKLHEKLFKEEYEIFQTGGILDFGTPCGSVCRREF
ncbi:hypothetical protein HK096_010894, partial [Nowakowskiella sp. JEL0078]